MALKVEDAEEKEIEAVNESEDAEKNEIEAVALMEQEHVAARERRTLKSLAWMVECGFGMAVCEVETVDAGSRAYRTYSLLPNQVTPDRKVKKSETGKWK